MLPNRDLKWNEIKIANKWMFAEVTVNIGHKIIGNIKTNAFIE